MHLDLHTPTVRSQGLSFSFVCPFDFFFGEDMFDPQIVYKGQHDSEWRDPSKELNIGGVYEIYVYEHENKVRSELSVEIYPVEESDQDMVYLFYCNKVDQFNVKFHITEISDGFGKLGLNYRDHNIAFPHGRELPRDFQDYLSCLRVGHEPRQTKTIDQKGNETVEIEYPPSEDDLPERDSPRRKEPIVLPQLDPSVMQTINMAVSNMTKTTQEMNRQIGILKTINSSLTQFINSGHAQWRSNDDIKTKYEKVLQKLRDAEDFIESNLPDAVLNENHLPM